MAALQSRKNRSYNSGNCAACLMFFSFPATPPSHSLTLGSTPENAQHACLAKHQNTHLTQVSNTVSFQGYMHMFNRMLSASLY